MLEVAAQFHCPRDIRYTGIDLFEARSAADGPGISLKAAHQLLQPTGARIQLVPGTPQEGLARVANELGKVDLVVLSAQPDVQHLAHAWFYIPRLLDERSQVFLETIQPGGLASLRLVDPTEIHLLAGAMRRRAA
jgi:hypothetical protein